MAEYQKFLFDNFILSDVKSADAVIEVPEPDTAVSVPEEADNAGYMEEEVPETEDKVLPPPIIQGYSEEELAEKVKAAEEAAFQNGRDSALSEIAAGDARLLSRMDEAVMKALSDYAALKEGLNSQFKEMAVSMLRQLVPPLLQENAETLVKSFLEDNFKNFAAEPKLSFYFNPEMVSKAGEIIGRLAHLHDFEGKITLHKDTALPVDSCRVEWENGGVERNSADMLAKAEKILDTE